MSKTAIIRSNTHPDREVRTTMVRCWGKSYPAYADDDGTVRVWDDGANYFTACHKLSERVQDRVRRETRPSA